MGNNRRRLKTGKLAILISGKKHSGKNYVAEALHKKLKNSEIIAFADPIKRIVSKTLEVSLDDLNNYKNSEKGIYIFNGKSYTQITNFRKTLQHFGTDAMQYEFGCDVWVKILLMHSTQDIVIVPDFRFKHEYLEMSKNLKCFTINVTGGDDGDSHISENNLSDFNHDYVLNNYYKEDITESINEIIRMIGLKNVI